MKYAHAFLLFILVVLPLNCGSVHTGGIDAMNQSVKELEETGISETAAEKWREVKRLANLANRAASVDDEAASLHFQALVTIQIALAEADAAQAILRARAGAAEAENEATTREIEAIQTAIESAQLKKEQARLRAHILLVVDESRRKAAADEEYRARFKGAKMDIARQAVGAQILERVYVFLEVMELFNDRKLLNEADVLSAREKYAAAVSALVMSDLFTVQSVCESLLAEVNRLIDTAWETAPETGMTPAIAETAAMLKSRNIEFEQDEIGCWVFLGATGSANADKRVAEILSFFVSLYKEKKSIAALVQAAAPNEKSLLVARKNSAKTAADWASRLIDLGVAAGDIRPRGCGKASPTVMLEKGKSPSALLIVPIPNL